jgi:hypothetical protein
MAAKKAGDALPPSAAKSKLDLSSDVSAIKAEAVRRERERAAKAEAVEAAAAVRWTLSHARPCACNRVLAFIMIRAEDEMHRIVGESQSLIRFLSWNNRWCHGGTGWQELREAKAEAVRREAKRQAAQAAAGGDQAGKKAGDCSRYRHGAQAAAP